LLTLDLPNFASWPDLFCTFRLKPFSICGMMINPPKNTFSLFSRGSCRQCHTQTVTSWLGRAPNYVYYVESDEKLEISVAESLFTSKIGHGLFSLNLFRSERYFDRDRSRIFRLLSLSNICAENNDFLKFKISRSCTQPTLFHCQTPLFIISINRISQA
jgi:hypothetical protein